MSTEPIDLIPVGARKEQHKAFRRVSTALIVSLAVMAGVLGFTNAIQAPRLSSAEINTQALTTRDGQRIVLNINQPLSDSRPVRMSISPDVPTEFTVDENTVTIRFAEMLDYNTEYTITVEAESAATGITGHIVHSFVTADVDVYSLLRDTREDESGQDMPDKIMRNKLSGDAAQVVAFESPRIQGYVVVRDRLGVITLDPNNTPTVSLISPSNGTETPIDTAGATGIDKLQAADTGDLIGYILDEESDDPNGLRSVLYLYDLAADSGVPTPVNGFDGKPLPVMDWMFVPGTTSVVAQAQDQQLYVIDPLKGNDPIPLGWHDEIRGFIPGTVKLVVANPQSGAIIDLAAGTTTTLALPEPQIPAGFYPGALELLAEDRYVLLNANFSSNEPGSSRLVLTDSAGSKEIFRTNAAGSRIRNFCLSPNGEYLAVEVISAEGVADSYPNELGYSATSIYFVRLEDATSNRGVNGFLPNWCRSSS
jgi:hypothetical protein